jgi:hypothetical protein
MRKLPDSATARRTPEETLLIACARRELDPLACVRIATAVAGDLDWRRVLFLAARHRLMPLLHWHLSHEVPDAVPGDVADALRRGFERNAARSLYLMGELRQIMALFEARGISVLPYKGPVLAQQLYGNVALRQMGDLDVMVRTADVPAARAALAEREFRSPDELSAWQEKAAMRVDANIMLVRQPGRLCLELHWAFAAGRHTCALGWDDVASRTDTFDCGGFVVPVFSREDLTVILSFHGARHMWERLEWLAGIAELMRQPGLRWDEALARADAAGVRRMVLLAADLAGRVLEAPVPGSVAAAITADAAVPRLAAEVESRMFNGEQVLAHTLGSTFHRFQLRSLERPGHRIRYVLHGALAPSREDWDVVRLPAPLFPLYLVLRPFRLAAQYGMRYARQAA